VSIAMQFVGTPYVYGGESPGGFDCSGLVKYAFAQVGVSLPHSSSALRGSGTVVSAAQARPGDLVWTPGHIAIYAGNGMVVEAVSHGTPLSYRAMWQKNPTFVRVV
jgi:cell wall-associated NlpC family hydrolase